MPAAKILVVDDDAFIRRPLELILHQEGFEARTAVDGDDCLRQVRAERPHLILLDVMMPGRDGFEICRALKSDPELADIPVILLSARDRERDRDRGLSAGASDYVTKPYAPAELLAKVRALVADDGGRGNGRS